MCRLCLFLLLFLFGCKYTYSQSTPALEATICVGDTAIMTANVSYADSLQWYRNDIPISGAHKDTLIVFSEGLYYVRAFMGSHNGCMDQSGDIRIMLDHPSLNDDHVPVAIGKVTAIPVLDNDDPRCAPFNKESLRITTPPNKGTIISTENGTVQYRPTTTVTGTDKFSYTVSDVEGREPFAATVTVELIVDCAVVYPNPVEQVLGITIDSDQIKALKIYDIQGRELYRTTVEQPNLNIDMSAFAQGWYILEFLKSGESACIIKIQKI